MHLCAYFLLTFCTKFWDFSWVLSILRVILPYSCLELFIGYFKCFEGRRDIYGGHEILLEVFRMSIQAWILWWRLLKALKLFLDGPAPLRALILCWFDVILMVSPYFLLVELQAMLFWSCDDFCWKIKWQSKLSVDRLVYGQHGSFIDRYSPHVAQHCYVPSWINFFDCLWLLNPCNI